MMWKVLWISVLLLSAVPVQSGDSSAVRPFLQTGNWYPSDPAQLNRLLDRLFREAPRTGRPGGRVVAMVSPHAGLTYSGRVAAAGYRLLKNQHVDRVILLGVAHRAALAGACVSTFEANATPLGVIPVDTAITRKLAASGNIRADNRIMTMEHSIENQLPFLQRVLKPGFRIVPVLLGSLDRRALRDIAVTLSRFVTDRTVIIASTDLTHYGRAYGYLPFTDRIPDRLEKLDGGFLERVRRRDLDGLLAYRKRTGITACGLVPVTVLLAMLQERPVAGRVVTYARSGDATGDYRRSVSYGAVVFEDGSGPDRPGKEAHMTVDPKRPVGLTDDERKTLLRLARQTLETYLSTGQTPPLNPADFPPRLQERYSVFVTLKRRGALRGCIGNLGEGDPLPVSVRDYAINAAVRDPRFPPVTRRELDDLTIEISVMTPMQPIDDWRDIRLGIDGVVIRKGFSSAVFLPQVATETGWGLDEFLSHLCQKAGLSSDAYREDGMKFFVFQAEVFSEEDVS